MTRMLLPAAAVITLVVTVSAQDSAAALDAALRAMGAARLRAIRYSGTGSIYVLGQAASPGGPWPRFRLARYEASINYDAPAMHEQVVRIDDERPPRGGGAGPFNPATGQGGIRPIPGEMRQSQLRDGRNEAAALAIWLTPHGFLKAAVVQGAAVRRARGRTEVSFMAYGKYPVSGVLDARSLVDRVETRVPNPMLGDMRVEMRFSDYKEFAGVQFPTRIVQRQGGHPTLDLTVTAVEPDAPAALEQRSGLAPAGTASSPTRVTPQKIADGVWFMSGGSPNSILVEFADHVVIVEAPQNEAYTSGVIEAARTLLPSKPIRFVVSTHHHFDHAGGLRAYVAEGIAILAHEAVARYYERILRNPFTLGPDRLARSPRAPRVEAVGARHVLSDGRRVLELHLLRGNHHSEGLLVAYLPRERLLIQADAFHPRPGSPPLPAPSPYTVNLLENIRRLFLDVAWVVNVHGGVDTFETLVQAAGG